jgi:transposase
MAFRVNEIGVLLQRAEFSRVQEVLAAAFRVFKSRRAVARALSTDERTIGRWLARLKLAGYSPLAEPLRRGRPRRSEAA